MPQTIRKYRILVASPSDVMDERDSINEVVSELNNSYGNRNDLTIEVIKWETHSAPAIGLTDTQDIIDKDFGDNYDLFIGFIWKKFGTPTALYGSGTEQEFRNAYEKFKVNPSSIQILFYFKNTPTSIYDIDPEQLLKIKNFRKDLGEKGVLYWEYNTIDELHKFLRIHIQMRLDGLQKSFELPIIHQVDQLSKSTVTTSPVLIEDKSLKPEIIPEDELGIVDYLEIIEEAFAFATESLHRISVATEWVGAEITKKADELTSLNKKGDNIGNKVLRDFFRRTGAIMDDYATRIEPEIPIYQSHFEHGTDALNELTIIYRSDSEGMWNAQVDEAIIAVKGLLSGLSNGLNGMRSFHSTINTLPRMEKDLNRARRKVEAILNDLVSSLEVTYDICTEVHKNLTE